MLTEQLFCAAGLKMCVKPPCYRTFLANYVNMHKGCCSKTNRPPAAVHHKLISFAEMKLQGMVVEPCDEGLYHSSVKIVFKGKQRVSH